MFGEKQLPLIEGSEKYYEVPLSNVNLLASALPAYHIAMAEFVLKQNSFFTENKPTDRAILGGFFPSQENIRAARHIAAIAHLSPEQCLYLDINKEPAEILTPEQRTRFHQVNLADLQTLVTTDGEPVIPEGSVKVIILDHVTEFMDDATLAKFFETLSKILAPDGVALMSTIQIVNRAELLVEKLKAFFIMKVKTFTRTQKQWQAAVEAQLQTSAVLDFTLEKQYRQLFILSKKGSVYPTSTMYGHLNEAEFNRTSIQISNSTPIEK